MHGNEAVLAAWAASGAMLLTGPADGPPSAAPAWVASAMDAAAKDLASETGRWGNAVVVDGPALLGERAAFTGMTRNGATSVGGSCRFVEVADGWVALNLSRPEDVASLPALVSASLSSADWPAVEAALRRMSSVQVRDQAALLGIPIGVAQNSAPPIAPASELERGGPRTPTARPLVVDLSALWAGPLAASLLVAAGARVIKVEGRRRSDGARGGTIEFFDLLNSGKECVEIDFSDREDQRFLRRLMSASDLVIEASRPRAMDAIGVDPAALAARGVSWLSITGHGRRGADADRVGFGDDAAVDGGLFVPSTNDSAPGFVADAAADPIAGIVGAAIAAEMLGSDRASVVEVPLSRAASWAARPLALPAAVRRAGSAWQLALGDDWHEVADPWHRPVPVAASPRDAHGAALRSEFAPPG
ncbi:MAG: hypothetical protein ACI9C1_002042 [Candidatus Aldehydirespiratoraceae bacterium]|jgi:hypothetical protein